ncbi:hypothetical protein H1235_03225 [Pseudoxanthomonas sp. NC8]|nr:hypothetical protein H1235_03225 [Pseudoxanthomonas sp. NC8]
MRGGLVYAFKQYNAVYGATTVLGSGNGFLYAAAPALAVSLSRYGHPGPMTAPRRQS